MIISQFSQLCHPHSSHLPHSPATHSQNELNLDVSSGILIPLYDVDTNMVILAGKGDRYMQFVEVMMLMVMMVVVMMVVMMMMRKKRAMMRMTMKNHNFCFYDNIIVIIVLIATSHQL